MKYTTRPAQRFLILATALLMLAGCTSTVRVVSEPEGAQIIDSTGHIWGRAPLETRVDRDAASVPGFTAEWPSGAKAVSADPVPLNTETHDTTVVLKRPEEAPGLTQDLKFALERAQERARQAEMERDRLEAERSLYGPWFFPHPFFY